MFKRKKKKEYYFVVYHWFNLTTKEERFCNILLPIHPLEWLVTERKLQEGHSLYELLFYKTVSMEEYLAYDSKIDY